MRDGDRGHWLPYLEWMITTSCDLACPGCDRFIDYKHNWTEDYTDIVNNMKIWSKNLDPDNLTLIGGEPLLHPRIYDIIFTASEIFNHATIEIYTNGLLLPKRPKLIEKLLQIKSAKISLTYHNKNSDIRNVISRNIDKHIFKHYSWRQTSTNTWKYQNIELEITDPTEGGWYDYRQEINGQLKPWQDNNPQESYQNCSVSVYPIIFQNRLYKCPPISMLRTHLEKYGNIDDEDWKPYSDYRGLSHDCSEDDLEKFIENINHPHDICGMCPANPQLKPQPEALIKHRMEKL